MADITDMIRAVAQRLQQRRGGSSFAPQAWAGWNFGEGNPTGGGDAPSPLPGINIPSEWGLGGGRVGPLPPHNQAWWEVPGAQQQTFPVAPGHTGPYLDDGSPHHGAQYLPTPMNGTQWQLIGDHWIQRPIRQYQKIGPVGGAQHSTGEFLPVPHTQHPVSAALANLRASRGK